MLLNKILFLGDPLISKRPYLESNPPVSKLTSPLSGGTGESFDILYSFYTLPPLKGEVPERSEGGGVNFKIKGEVVKEVRSEGVVNKKIGPKGRRG